MSSPLDDYQHAIEALEANPTRETYEASLKAHRDCISYALLKAPWYAKGYRERRFSKLQQRHAGVGNEAEIAGPLRVLGWE